MSRRLILVTLLLLLHSGYGCTPRPRPASPEPRTPASRPSSRPSRLSDRPGMEAIRKWALSCYQLALKHNPVFSKGGTMVVRWNADQDGNLLFFDFATDTFGSWEVAPSGETLAACISRRIKAEKIRWSSSGTAPLRFSPTD